MWTRLNKILKEEDRIEAFDFIRSLAAISVILTHFEIFDLKSVDIDAFFILSGFLIAQILSQNATDVNRKYIVSRFTKIVPSYFFLLIVGFVAGKLLFDEVYGVNLPDASEWKQYFFFYRNYGGLPNRWALEHVWTICVEEHFYIMILVFSVLCGARAIFSSRLVLFGILLVIGSTALKCQAIFTNIAEYPTYTHNRLDTFGYGILLFVFYDKLKDIRRINNPVLFILVLATLVLFVLWDTTEHHLYLRLVSPIALSILLVYLCNFRYHPIFRIFAYYSYNAYLWHFFILIPIVFYFGYTPIGFVIYLLMTILLAFITTHLVEDFFMNKRQAIYHFLFGK